MNCFPPGALLLSLVLASLPRTSSAQEPIAPPAPADRCVEACALIQQITPSAQQSAWNALESFSNAPNETLELFSPSGASLYIKGESLPLSAALLNNNPAAIRLYQRLQTVPSGHGSFFTWNDDGCSVNRTDLSWLRCLDTPDAPIISITVTTPHQKDTTNLLQGAWAGAYTDQHENADRPTPEKQAGQMNALFILDESTVFFRFSDNRQKLHGEGLLLNHHLVGHACADDDDGFFYFDAALDPTNQALRGTALTTENRSIITRRFFLKKEQP